MTIVPTLSILCVFEKLNCLVSIPETKKPKKTTFIFLDPPLWAGKDSLLSASRDDEQIQIVCNVCAQPPVDSFTWVFNGGTIRYGIERNVSQIKLNSHCLCKENSKYCKW